MREKFKCVFMYILLVLLLILVFFFGFHMGEISYQNHSIATLFYLKEVKL